MTTDNRPTARKPLGAAVLTGIAIIVLALIVLAYASPYLVLSRVRDAVQQRDAAMIDKYVDYPALRTSLKQQVTQWLSRRVQTQKLQHPLAALGALVGMAFVEPLVDAYATPDGVAALLAGLPPRGEPGEAPPSMSDQSMRQAEQAPQQQQTPPGPAPASPAAAPPAGPHAKSSAGYRDMDTFALNYAQGADTPPYSVVFHRRGWFSWQIDAVEIPQ
jgi:nucleoid-associated protein YgaU